MFGPVHSVNRTTSPTLTPTIPANSCKALESMSRIVFALVMNQSFVVWECDLLLQTLPFPTRTNRTSGLSSIQGKSALRPIRSTRMSTNSSRTAELSTRPPICPIRVSLSSAASSKETIRRKKGRRRRMRRRRAPRTMCLHLRTT